MDEPRPARTRMRLPPLAIRADAGGDIGMGHVMRCLALAERWQACGGDVRFLTCADDAGLAHLRARGIEVDPAPVRHPGPADLPWTLGRLTELEAEHGAVPWLITDGYHFDPRFHRGVRQAGFPLLILDDVAHLPYYDADLLLNPGAASGEIEYPTAPDTRLLLGTEYVLLRREFRTADQPAGDVGNNPLGDVTERSVPEGGAGTVLVTFGGSDPHNMTAAVIEALLRTPGRPKIRAVIGPKYEHREQLASLVKRLDRDGRCELLHDVRDMPKAFHGADLAVTAGGMTCFEMAHMGVPLIAVTVAENQRPTVRRLVEAGVAQDLGWYETVSREGIVTVVERLLGDAAERRAMGAAGPRLVDGNGPGRVVCAMCDVYDERMSARTPGA